jgi:hypothetical protein
MDHRYEEVRRINAAVKPIAGTLLGLTWDGDARASVSPKTVDAQAFRAADGTRYLCLVNQDTHSAVSASVKTPSLTDAATGAAVVPARVELGPGEGRLLRLGAR